jgi:hypothetical protein
LFYLHILQDFSGSSKSTDWFLPQNFASHVPFHYTTVTLGIDPGYSKQDFYNRILDNDTKRVVDRFRNAQKNQVRIKKGAARHKWSSCLPPKHTILGSNLGRDTSF